MEAVIKLFAKQVAGIIRTLAVILVVVAGMIILINIFTDSTRGR